MSLLQPAALNMSVNLSTTFDCPPGEHRRNRTSTSPVGRLNPTVDPENNLIQLISIVNRALHHCFRESLMLSHKCNYFSHFTRYHTVIERTDLGAAVVTGALWWSHRHRRIASFFHWWLGTWIITLTFALPQCPTSARKWKIILEMLGRGMRRGGTLP